MTMDTFPVAPIAPGAPPDEPQATVTTSAPWQGKAIERVIVHPPHARVASNGDWQARYGDWAPPPMPPAPPAPGPEPQPSADDPIEPTFRDQLHSLLLSLFQPHFWVALVGVLAAVAVYLKTNAHGELTAQIVFGLGLAEVIIQGFLGVTGRSVAGMKQRARLAKLELRRTAMWAARRT